MIKRFLIIVLCFLMSFSMFAQKKGGLKAELGLTGGVMFYLGDVNQEKLFYNPQSAIGGMFRYNFHDFLALRLTGVHGKIMANDEDFDYKYQQDRRYSFETGLTDITLQLEINFLQLSPEQESMRWSPYVAGGVGAYYANDNENAAVAFSIPFGVGIKYCPTERLTLGIEWGMRKTYSDDLDALSPDYMSNTEGEFGLKQKTFVENSDLFSYTGIYISYKFFESKFMCSAYGKNLRYHK